ncbi:MAG TPA: amidohydrolase family protein [Gemmatimonadaceae bacterium]|nr:amidohydrolase family protein [Gemmatimonadaceae bacterium]
MMVIRTFAFGLAALIATATSTGGQEGGRSAMDPSLFAEISRIQAIDNHAHPPKLVGAGEKDDDFDALPCDPLEPTLAGLMTRPENPQYVQAWKALWGYGYEDRAPAHVRDVLAAKARAKSAHGDAYPSWVLSRVGIDVELSNRVAMGRGLDDAHHRWVPFDDALLFPLDNAPLAAQTPDRPFFFSREDMLRARYMNDAGVRALPPTLSEYVTRVVTPTLEQQKRRGAVAVKFEAAYLRSLDFAAADEPAAAAIYARYASGGAPDTAQYRRLQDYLFRYVAKEAGRLGLPVHIHTGGGCGGYFYLAGANPLLLEPVLNDATLRRTTFVLLHAGAVSYTPSIAYLVMKPNVYADLSQQTWMESAQHLATSLRYWLEWYPEKILFGTDLSPGPSPEIDWEELAWQTNDTARRALAIALTGMMRDGEITRAQAIAFAHEVLHDNAGKLYGIGR